MHDTDVLNADTRPRSRVGSIFLDVGKFAFVALLIITPFRFFVAQPFIVSGASMAPTFESKEYLVIDELSYRFEKPQRGDVVIFRYPLEPTTYFIKRVIGLPTETVVIENGRVSIIPQYETEPIPLAEPYLSSATSPRDNNVTKLGDDEYFVLGDNRRASSDSRVWGPLPEKYIVGRALVRVLPLGEVEFFPGEYKFD